MNDNLIYSGILEIPRGNVPKSSTELLNFLHKDILIDSPDLTCVTVYEIHRMGAKGVSQH
jgi:hypothetical protein